MARRTTRTMIRPSTTKHLVANRCHFDRSEAAILPYCCHPDRSEAKWRDLGFRRSREGPDFSRAVEAMKCAGALAPEVSFSKSRQASPQPVQSRRSSLRRSPFLQAAEEFSIPIVGCLQPYRKPLETGPSLAAGVRRSSRKQHLPSAASGAGFRNSSFHNLSFTVLPGVRCPRFASVLWTLTWVSTVVVGGWPRPLEEATNRTLGAPFFRVLCARSARLQRILLNCTPCIWRGSLTERT